ncbi:uncharacterized protein LOC132882877 [Neoarius graeffei]|uniref:uncharacterized protein LOC132882877 n=1 Tax=Neoarius graeffei TaxID=443677 RepID=UPI00298BCC43|nr:uncharacterized protein LOC132882877 [Neoarius graeffei]
MGILILVALLFVGAIAHPENGWHQGHQGPGPVGGGFWPMGGGPGPVEGGSEPMGGVRKPIREGSEQDIGQDYGSVRPLDYAAHRGGPRRGGPGWGGPRRGGPGWGGPHRGGPFSPNTQFIPLFKTDNITLQGLNLTLPLKEGENIFILPTIQGRPQMYRSAPQEQFASGWRYGAQPYVKIIYNPNATQKISFEYGVMQFLPWFLKAEVETNDVTAV